MRKFLEVLFIYGCVCFVTALAVTVVTCIIFFAIQLIELFGSYAVVGVAIFIVFTIATTIWLIIYSRS